MDTKKTILIVEDEMPLQSAIQTQIEKKGFNTVTARSVDQALSYLQEVKEIGAVWLDHYLLGKRDGLSLVSQLKESESNWKHIPIFVVSNTATPDKVQMYIKLGVDNYYVKAENRLKEIIDDVISNLN